MHEAYALAHREIITALNDGGLCLDCGASTGNIFSILNDHAIIEKEAYYGIEWNKKLAETGQKKFLNIVQGDLNIKMSFPDNKFKCVFGLSVLEHLLNPCLYLKECYRVLEANGRLVLLTPNISTYFTALLILLGKMPSSGPHPDSDILLEQEQLFKVSSQNLQNDTENDTPVHRHLVVFSYKVLKQYLKTIGFTNVIGYGFGIYPFPNFIQPFLEKIDPYHSHQMVFIASK